MRNRLAPFVLVVLLLVLALTLAGCERDRPAATSGTPGVLLPIGTTGPGTPGPEGEQVLATPIPLEGTTATPSLLRPAATSQAQAGTAAPAAASPAGAAGVYTVQRGDNLGSIAQKFGMTTKDLLAVNPSITNPDVLTVGQQIKLPAGPSLSAPAASSGSTSSGQTGGTQVYTVQKGDILSSIAKRFGVTLAALQQANNITNPDKIIVGQKLTIPAGSSAAAPAASSGSRSYTVQRGDTMGTIAVKFGVTVAQLQAANNIADPNKITVGQVLKIP